MEELETFLKRKCRWAKAQEKMLDITNQQRNADQNHLTPVSEATVRAQVTSAGEGVDNREPSDTAGGGVKWCSHYAEPYGGSSKSSKESDHRSQ